MLEHVGSFEKQVLFVGELCRVARRVFITVPNKFFPVEHHTALPLAHYQPHTFKMACRLTGQDDWANDKNLILMTRKRLRRIAARLGRSASVGYTGLRLGPFSSNLFLIRTQWTGVLRRRVALGSPTRLVRWISTHLFEGNMYVPGRR